MSGPAIRSRLNALRQERQAARLGRDLLDDKREAILRALLDRLRRHAALAAEVRAALARARSLQADACVDAGTAAVDAAALAQPLLGSVEWRPRAVVGVATPRLQVQLKPFAPAYGAAATSFAVDRAGEAFAALMPLLVRLAEEEEATRNLRTGLAKTVRRLKALEQAVLPRLDRDIRDVAAALDEEERGESLRRQRWKERRKRSGDGEIW